MKSEKQHWFSFVFIDSSIVAGSTTHASAIIGYTNKIVTISRVESAKKFAKVSSEAVMLSCSYLGHMTKDVMENLE